MNKILDFTSGIIGKCLYSYCIITQKEKKLLQQKKAETHGHASLQILAHTQGFRGEVNLRSGFSVILF